MKYDYKIINQEYLTQEDFEQVFQNMGDQEWKLVSVTQIHTPTEKTTAYFVREKKEIFVIAKETPQKMSTAAATALGVKTGG